MSKPRGTPVKPSAFKSTEAASSTKKPVLKKRKANDQSEDHDVVGEDPSKTKTDHDEMDDVEYYQNSAESKDGEDDEGQDEEDVISGDGKLIENAEQPDDSEQGEIVKEIINSA